MLPSTHNKPNQPNNPSKQTHHSTHPPNWDLVHLLISLSSSSSSHHITLRPTPDHEPCTHKAGHPAHLIPTIPHTRLFPKRGILWEDPVDEACEMMRLNIHDHDGSHGFVGLDGKDEVDIHPADELARSTGKARIYISWRTSCEFWMTRSIPSTRVKARV